MTTTRKYAIIAAGGSGLRLGAEVPKQFLLLTGKPLLQYSLEAFHHYDSSIKLILVLPEAHIETWKRLREDQKTSRVAEPVEVIPHTIVPGGQERFHSVRNALELLGPDEGLVAIHDGARPFASAELIKRCFEEAEMHGSAIPAVSMKESLRQNTNGKWQHVDRNGFKAIQTPQVFNLKMLWQAYKKPYQPIFTDDASVFEAAGNEIHMVEGEYGNLKVTTAEDLERCAFYLNRNK